MLIFVYGSLLKGFQNNYILENSTFVGEFATVEGYILVGAKSRSFPYVLNRINGDASTQIMGELYDVSEDTMNKLDKLEGYPTIYNRKIINITNGVDIVCSNIYILENQDLIDEIHKSDRFLIISHGDWKKYCKSNPHIVIV